MKKVTLQIGDEEFAFAQRTAKQDGYSGPVDFLNGLLNTALLEWMDDTPDGHARDPVLHVVRTQEAKIEMLKTMLLETLKEIARRDLRDEMAVQIDLTASRRWTDDKPGWFDEFVEDPGGGDLDDGNPF